MNEVAIVQRRNTITVFIALCIVSRTVWSKLRWNGVSLPSFFSTLRKFLSFCLTRRDETRRCVGNFQSAIFRIINKILFSAFYETGVRNAALKCVFIVSNVIQANKLLQVKKNPIDPLVLSAIVCKAALEGDSPRGPRLIITLP
jgi:hypothetical protein